jgi:hypothetical protein
MIFSTQIAWLFATWSGALANRYKAQPSAATPVQTSMAWLPNACQTSPATKLAKKAAMLCNVPNSPNADPGFVGSRCANHADVMPSVAEANTP